MRLLFIGDSLIEFNRWEDHFPGYEVLNLGIAGESVEGLYSRLDQVFRSASRPDNIFIMTGINNLAMDDRSFLKTYRNVIQRFRSEYPSSKIYINSLLPVLFPMISNEDIRNINEQLRQMSEEEGVSYLDIHSLFLNAEGIPVASYLLEDGVHVSDEGYRVWSGRIKDFLLSG